MDSTPEVPRRWLSIVALCAQGMTREEIGSELFLSPLTVKTYLDATRRMIDARNVTHAVAICITLGYLEVDHDAGIVFLPDEPALAVAA